MGAAAAGSVTILLTMPRRGGSLAPEKQAGAGSGTDRIDAQNQHRPDGPGGGDVSIVDQDHAPGI
jgi:hypothetical protein